MPMTSDLAMQLAEAEPSAPSGRLHEHGAAAAASFVTAGAELGADGASRSGSWTTVCADEALGISGVDSCAISGCVSSSHRTSSVASSCASRGSLTAAASRSF